MKIALKAYNQSSKRGYAKDIEYPDWEQYETFDNYEYRGEVNPTLTSNHEEFTYELDARTPPILGPRYADS